VAPSLTNIYIYTQSSFARTLGGRTECLYYTGVREERFLHKLLSKMFVDRMLLRRKVDVQKRRIDICYDICQSFCIIIAIIILDFAPFMLFTTGADS